MESNTGPAIAAHHTTFKPILMNANPPSQNERKNWRHIVFFMQGSNLSSVPRCTQPASPLTPQFIKDLLFAPHWMVYVRKRLAAALPSGDTWLPTLICRINSKGTGLLSKGKEQFQSQRRCQARTLKNSGRPGIHSKIYATDLAIMSIMSPP